MNRLRETAKPQGMQPANVGGGPDCCQRVLWLEDTREEQAVRIGPKAASLARTIRVDGTLGTVTILGEQGNTSGDEGEVPS